MTTDPTTTAARADAMTEEPPRDLAALVADALHVTEQADAIGRATDAATTQDNGRAMAGAHAWQTARLARQVAELAQHVARLDADSIGDALARGVIEHADSIGRTYDDDPDGPRSVAYDTGRNIGDALVTPPGAQILADWMAAPAPAACPDYGFGTITLPLDANGEPLAWPDGRGHWIDAWRGIYTTDELRRELPHWTASPGTRTLAYGVTTWDTHQ